MLKIILIIKKVFKMATLIYPLIVGIVNIIRDGKDMPKAGDLK